MFKKMFLMLLLIATQTAYADCITEYFNIYPQSSTISPNSIFMLEGAWFTQEIIEELNKKYPIYLVNGKEKTPLKVVAFYKGQYKLTQAILKATQELKPHQKYELKIDNLEKDFANAFKRWNKETKEYEGIVWEVTETMDHKKPIVTGVKYIVESLLARTVFLINKEFIYIIVEQLPNHHYKNHH